MVFLIEKIKGSWFWRLRSTLFKRVVASSHGCETKKECLKEIAVVKEAASEASIRMADGAWVDDREEPPKAPDESVA
ncbi:MAG: YegP family protein [Armatimonadota bacterium]|nr:YegP family protein [Armatimonadota bacterium]